jgi:hypothetical protein
MRPAVMVSTCLSVAILAIFSALSAAKISAHASILAMIAGLRFRWFDNDVT